MTFLYFTWCPQVREPPQEQFAVLSGSGIFPQVPEPPQEQFALLSGSWIFPQVRELFGVNLLFLLVPGFPQVQDHLP